MYPDRVSADGLAKDRPTQVAFSLDQSPPAACFGVAAGGWHKKFDSVLLISKIKGRAAFFNVMACAVGRSSVQVVPRTADVKLSRSSSRIGRTLIVTEMCLFC